MSFLEDECNEKVGAALSPRRTSFPTRVVAPPPSPPTVGAKDTVLEKPTKEARAALSTSSPTSAQWDAFLNAMLSKVEIDAKIDAKFEAIQESLLLEKSWRPPLSTTSNTKNAEKRVTTGTTNAKTKEVRVGKKSERRQSAPAPAIAPRAPASQETWSDVVERKEKRRRAKDATEAQKIKGNLPKLWKAGKGR